MLYREILRPQAATLFDVLGASPELQGLTLIGGTALALQLGHRSSLDFDFATFGGTLPGFQIDRLIDRLKHEGHAAQMITSQQQISQFRINRGSNLLDHARDYVVNGVKITFFVHGKTETQEAFYQKADKVRPDGFCFDLLGIEGLKAAKTLVLADRIKSRDLYDLYTLMHKQHYTLEQLFSTVQSLGTIDDPEYYKAIMRGEIALDTDDEGLEPIALGDAYQLMYDYFNQAIDEYETALAKAYFLSGHRKP